MKNKYIWLLAIAIVTEISGTVLLALSSGMSRLLPTVMALVAYTTSYYFLARSLKRIPIGIAYAIWSGIGIMATKFINYTLFDSPIYIASLTGMMMIILGVIIINLLSKSNMSADNNEGCE